MQQAIAILPVVLPVAFWAAYHYHKDRHLPEPAINLVIAFGLGLFAATLSKLMYMALQPLGLRLDAVALADSNPLGLFAYAMLAIGPIEEIAKMLPFLLVVLRMKAFDEPVDGIIYASFIALGYAAAENFHYLDFLTPWQAAARGFASPVVHIVFASIWAHRITGPWLRRESLLIPALSGLLMAAALHGFYDFLVLLNPALALPFAAALILVVWIWRLRLMHEMHKQARDGTPRD